MPWLTGLVPHWVVWWTQSISRGKAGRAGEILFFFANWMFCEIGTNRSFPLAILCRTSALLGEDVTKVNAPMSEHDKFSATCSLRNTRRN